MPVKIIGDGGHAKVIRDLMRQRIYIDTGTVIGIGDNRDRKRVAEELTDEISIALVHTFATRAMDCEIGDGTVVMAGAIIQAGAKIGKHCIVNTGATVDHDCVIEDFAHIAPGVHLCGGVHVGEGALVGVGSCAVPGAKIKAWSLVKAGSVCK